VRPYLVKVERGIFATRAPARLNHTGISALRLLRVDGSTLLVSDGGMLDGTPLLDIKPYVPAFARFATERVGWCGAVSAIGVVADPRRGTVAGADVLLGAARGRSNAHFAAPSRTR
jgi:tRNA (Thr-GGU) A37 N-methylase